MNKSIFKITLVILVAVVSDSCTKTKTNRELFDEGLEKNVVAGMKPLVDIGVDSIAARNYMTCVLEMMYQIDSTYFLKEPNEAKKIFIKNEDKLQECMSYLPPKDSLKHVVRELDVSDK